MKFPFKKQPALAGAPTNAAAYSKQIDAWLADRPFEEKARLVAGVQTGGEVEARVRFCKDGRQEYSLWLCLPGSDEALRLVPASDEQEARHGGDVR